LPLAIISIGDEITTGSVVDTNSAWISEFLLEHGMETRLHLSVPDDLRKVSRALRFAQTQARIVIVSGGLGPTVDDLTTEAACQFLGVRPVLNQHALDMIESRFRAIGREMTNNNRKQAMIPEGAELLENPFGTAPGYVFATKRACFFFVPGVPVECRRMIEHQVLSKILAREKGKKIFRPLILRTFGLTESRLDQSLAELELPRNVRMGFRAVFPEIQIKLIASGKTEASVVKALSRAQAAIKEKVGQYIFSENGRSLEQVVGDLLREKNRTLAIAESCTAGLIAKRLTDIPGSSDYFLAGFITYSNKAKTDMLEVPGRLIQEKGAVSSEVALAMAEGARSKAGSDMALAVTGIAGPTGGTAEKPVGTMHIAIADERGTWEKKLFLLRAERSQIRELAAQTALEVIRRRLLGQKNLEF